jgi:hypothetical protein
LGGKKHPAAGGKEEIGGEKELGGEKKADDVEKKG